MKDLEATLTRRPQDTALLESNRSGGLRQWGFCLRGACWSNFSTRPEFLSNQAPWPHAKNSGGLEAEPPWTPPEKLARYNGTKAY